MNSERMDRPATIARDILPLAIVSVPLSGVLSGLSYVARARGDATLLEELVFVALFLCVVSGLGLWFWLGYTRWQARLAVLALGVAILEYAGTAALGVGVPRVFVWTVIAAVFGSFGLFVAILRPTRFRRKLVPARFATGPLSRRASGLVFSIADILLWTIGAAAVFSVARLIPAEEVKLFVRVVVGLDLEVVLLALGGVSCVVGSLIAVWTVFGTSRLWMRLLALFVGVAAAGWLIVGVYAWYVAGVRGWAAPLEVVPFVWLQSLLVAVGLCVFRACGYRLVRVDSASETAAPEAELAVNHLHAARTFDLTHSPVGS